MNQIVIPLTKFDVERRLVIGTAALEQPDLSREIMDYETAKPAFEAWSQSFQDATGGLSKGNLRVMHTKTVAGRVDQISYDDAAKRIEVAAHVIDDNEWSKCLKGAYTGFSIGGGYAKKWQDGDLTRYTPRIAELSLVDSPCMPGARFAELVKADGLTEQVELRGRNAAPSSFAALWKNADQASGFAAAWAKRPQSFDDLAKAAKQDQPVSVESPARLAVATGATALGLGAAHQYRNMKTARDHLKEATRAHSYSLYHLGQARNSELSDHTRQAHAELGHSYAGLARDHSVHATLHIERVMPFLRRAV